VRKGLKRGEWELFGLWGRRKINGEWETRVSRISRMKRTSQKKPSKTASLKEILGRRGKKGRKKQLGKISKFIVKFLEGKFLETKTHQGHTGGPWGGIETSKEPLTWAVIEGGKVLGPISQWEVSCERKSPILV